MKAYLLSIGDEILIGQILNTNAAWMANELNGCGVHIERMVTLADTREAILEAVADAEQHADLVLITGGLGPTKDDITKKTLCELFGLELAYHEPSFENMIKLFEQFGRVPDDRYKIQAYMPVGATVLINKVGTASGMWFERNGKIVVSMPGVPKEMKYLTESEVMPRLQARKNIPAIEHQTLICFGKGETDLSEMLEDFEAELPTHIKLAYLPNTTTGYVRLRLTGRGEDKEALKIEVTAHRAKMQAILGTLIIGRDEASIEAVVGQILREKKLTLGSAESCTGGNIAHKITSIVGSSDYFKGSVVAYSNEVKRNVLGVSSETLDTHGAVSEETIVEMAKGAMQLLNVDYAIATSGIAGPGGERPDKPVGTIWVGIAHKNGVFTKKLQLGNNRERNIEMTSSIALNMLRQMLHED